MTRPPSPSLPIPDSDDTAQFSQPPLCTPVDQPVIRIDAVTASPVRTTVKRRRPNTTTTVGSLFDFNSSFNNNFGTNRPFRPLQHSSRPNLLDDDSLPINSQTCSQRDLPDMSQDTLALFPRIVREHHLSRFSNKPLTNLSTSPKRLEHQDSYNIPWKRMRKSSDISRGLAKASLISTLSGADPLQNPYLSQEDSKNLPNVLPADIGETRLPAKLYANASESYQDVDRLILDDDLEKAHATSKLPPFSSKSTSPESEALKSLKLLLVSSTQGRKMSIDFESNELAGKGAFSEVWRVTHRLDGCTYALKRNSSALLNDKSRLDSLQEVFALSALQGHPNILRYYDAWFEDKGRYLYMQTEFLPGGSLQAMYIDVGLEMSSDDLLSLASDLSCGLSYMHNKGIVHVDIKPENIFRNDRGLTRPSFIIGDFGLGCHTDGKNARSTEGDSRYLCPEAFASNSQAASTTSADMEVGFSDDEAVPKNCNKGAAPTHDLRAGDVFSMGATLYELATGIPLAKSGPKWRFLRESTADVIEEVSAKCKSDKLAKIIGRCLDPNPCTRATATEIMELCRPSENCESAKKVKQLQKELRDAISKVKRYEAVTASILKNGEAGRRQYRSIYPRTSNLTTARRL